MKYEAEYISCLSLISSETSPERHVSPANCVVSDAVKFHGYNARSTCFERISTSLRNLVVQEKEKNQHLPSTNMPPAIIVDSTISEVRTKEYDEWSLKSLWYGFADWVVRVAHGINDESTFLQTVPFSIRYSKCCSIST